MEKNARIVSWVDGHRDEFLQDLTDLCSIDSTAGPAREGAIFYITWKM